MENRHHPCQLRCTPLLVLLLLLQWMLPIAHAASHRVVAEHAEAHETLPAVDAVSAVDGSHDHSASVCLTCQLARAAATNLIEGGCIGIADLPRVFAPLASGEHCHFADFSGLCVPRGPPLV